MEQPNKSFQTYLENKVFQDEEFLAFLEDIKERNFVTEDVYLELRKSLDDKEVKNILKVWVQAEVLYYLIEYPIAIGVWALVVSNIWEINYSSLSTWALAYAGLLIPSIMVSRLSILSILTHYTKVPERKNLISTWIIPLLPSQVFLGVWLRNHGKFLKILLQYIRTKSLREDIQKVQDEWRKQRLIEQEKKILLWEDSLSRLVSSVKSAFEKLKIPFKN